MKKERIGTCSAKIAFSTTGEKAVIRSDAMVRCAPYWQGRNGYLEDRKRKGKNREGEERRGEERSGVENR